MEWLSTIAGLIIGGGAGAAIAYLLAERRGRSQAGAAQMALGVADQKILDLSDRLTQETQQTAALRAQLSEAEKQTSALQVQLQTARENLQEQKALLDDAQAKLREAFASVSAEALAKNNEAFLQLARERFATLSKEAAGTLDERKAQIEGLLKPMQELLGQYQNRLSEIEKSRVESYSMLREQLGTLAETQRTLKTQTSQLVTALSRPTTRGQWGEISLRRLVELAGMSNRCDFVEQSSVDTEDGRLRPDMIVNMPGARQIIIDCKCILDAFLDAAAATDQEIRRSHLQRHAQQVRSRVRDLSTKSYWSQFARSPEYVVMFLPGEAFLYAAVEMDGTLIEDAMKNRVILATPTTLIALLRAIEFGWRQEEISENAEKIRTLGVELYERISTMAGHFEKLGTNLSQSVSAYNSTIASLESRVMVTARKMGELGARTDKALPEPERLAVAVRELPAALRSQNP